MFLLSKSFDHRHYISPVVEADLVWRTCAESPCPGRNNPESRPDSRRAVRQSKPSPSSATAMNKRRPLSRREQRTCLPDRRDSREPPHWSALRATATRPRNSSPDPAGRRLRARNSARTSSMASQVAGSTLRISQSTRALSDSFSRASAASSSKSSLRRHRRRAASSPQIPTGRFGQRRRPMSGRRLPPDAPGLPAGRRPAEARSGRRYT